MNRLIKNAVSSIGKSSMIRQRLLKNHLTPGKQVQLRQLSGVENTATKPNIQVSRSSALHDEEVSVTVSGLQSGQKVTLQTFVDKGSKSYGSCGHFIADNNGNVDTFKNVCHGGTFDGLEPMGLFWSMKSLPGLQLGRLLNDDVTQPVNVDLFVLPSFLEFEDLVWSKENSSLSQCNFVQMFMDPNVELIHVKENGFIGTLFLPPGDGPFPAVTDIFGMNSTDPCHRSSLLASRGIASMVVTYVGKEGTAQTNDDLDFHCFLRAFDWLSNHPKVDSNSMGALASCSASFYTNVIAWKRPQVKCLVTINNTFGPAALAQHVEGEFIRSCWPLDLRKATIIDGCLILSSIICWDLVKTLQPFPYWRHGAKVLEITCEDDLCINPDISTMVQKQLPLEFADNFEFIRYPGAGHILDTPHHPLCESVSNFFGMKCLWGGTPKQHAYAQADSWPRIISFFQKHLNAKSHSAA